MIKITRDSHTAGELHALSRRTKDLVHAIRLRGIAMVLEGYRRSEAAWAQGVEVQTLADWVRRYNADGPEGLVSKPKGGTRCRLSEAQLDELRGWMEEGPDLERDGLTRWRVADIAQRIGEEFGVRYSVEGVRRLLRRLGFRHVSARPVHPKADEEKQAAFRLKFPESVKEAVREKDKGKPVEIWFQDESRVGQKGMLSRVWAAVGKRPRVQRDQRYGYCYLFGAACASSGAAVGLVTPRANTEWMNEHLAAISEAVSPGAIGVVVLNGASWHKSGDLTVPENLRLLTLPPYSPELNPMEQVFQYLKANRFANQVFKNVAAVQEACQAGWDWSGPCRRRSPRSCTVTGRWQPRQQNARQIVS